MSNYFPFKRNVCSSVEEAHPRPSAIVSLASRTSRATSWVSSSTWRWNPPYVCPCFESPCHDCPCHGCPSYGRHLLGHQAHLPHLVLLHLGDHLGSPATMSINTFNPQTDIIHYNHHQKGRYSHILIILKPCHRNLITRLLRSVGILTSTPVLLFTHSRGTSLLCIFSSYL